MHREGGSHGARSLCARKKYALKGPNRLLECHTTARRLRLNSLPAFRLAGLSEPSRGTRQNYKLNQKSGRSTDFPANHILLQAGPLCRCRLSRPVDACSTCSLSRLVTDMRTCPEGAGTG